MVDPHFDEGKHIYWRALNKSGKRKALRLGLENKPYPKTTHGTGLRVEMT